MHVCMAFRSTTQSTELESDIDRIGCMYAYVDRAENGRLEQDFICWIVYAHHSR